MAVSPLDKSFPPSTWGVSESDVAAAAHPIDHFQTPLLTIDRAMMDANVQRMAEWALRAGVSIAPHGKTTMSPELWRRQLDAGAWGLTLATVWQTQVARTFDIERVMLANTLVDPVALAWVAAELAADPRFTFFCWVDGVETVKRMTAILAALPAGRPIGVIVELGADGGRTGARTVESAMDIARAIDRSPALALGGCGGYEGALAHDRSGASLARVSGYLDRIAELHRALDDEGLYRDGTAIVTAGGSAYFDLVVDSLGALADPVGERGTATTVLLRSGAYIVHDDGFYRGISPAAQSDGDWPVFSPALHVWVRVVSRPEPGLVLFDGGKRDLPFDDGLPEAQRVRGLAAEESDAILRGSEVTALNDQHGFLRLADDVPAGALPVGTVIRLGISHPCTAFDKWSLIPVVDDAEAATPVVVELVKTYF